MQPGGYHEAPESEIVHGRRPGVARLAGSTKVRLLES
jgi:hypothetical protein